MGKRFREHCLARPRHVAQADRAASPWLGSRWLAFVLLMLPSPDVEARGKFVRRREARGETTSTSPKLSTFAFVDDSEGNAYQLTLFVDALPARHVVSEGLLTVGVGLARRGPGEPLEVRPDLFRLSWPRPDAAPSSECREGLRPLTSTELRDRVGGAAAVDQAARIAALGPAGVPISPVHGQRVRTRFHAVGAGSAPAVDRVELPVGSWLADTLHFQLPATVPDRWDTRFHLTFCQDATERALATVTFRVERDPQLQREAFRRARKAQRVEDTRSQREERKARRGDR